MEGEITSIAPKTPEQFERDKIIRTLNSIGLMMENLTKDNEFIDPKEAKFKVDEIHLGLESAKPQTGFFHFEGNLTKSATFPELKNDSHYIPVIKNLAVPPKVRGQGIASSLIRSWEGSLSANGYHTFVVTNVSGPEAVKFWKNKGYQMSEKEIKPHAPGFMYKRKD